MASRALVIVVGLLAGGCQADLPEPRALARGFQPEAGVLAPYDDGKLHLAAGRYGLAIERFGQALTGDRRSPDALNGLAIAYARLGRFDVARAYFERALEVDPFSAPTLNNYGRALLEEGRLRDAGAFLQAALQHASQTELTTVADNLASVHRTRPPAVVAALAATPRPPTEEGRLIRLAANRYRLETSGLPSRQEASDAAHHPAALGGVPQQPAGRLQAPPSLALTEVQAGVPAGVAGGVDGFGIALSSTANLTEVQAAVRAGVAGAVDGLGIALSSSADFSEVQAGVPAGTAGAIDGWGIALSSTADLEALVPEKQAADPQTGGSRGALLSEARAGSRGAVPVLTRGEPT